MSTIQGHGPLRIANCSGFYGDRHSAMREMLHGGEVDVLTGDYLAELTMLILGKDRMRDPGLGYARTFLSQVEECLGEALRRGVKIVSNAGGLNPAGLAARLEQAAAGLGLSPRIAYVSGDDLSARADELGFPGALTANAYLGGAGIARALAEGADIVVTGRVTDASLVVGPARWHFGWSSSDYDELAGAVVAGHVIECGTQATGGNFSGFSDLPHDARPLGFPLAEVYADGGSVITKHEDTPGAVTLDTVTAQLLYEIQGPIYQGPDVRTDLTSVRLHQEGVDRVRIEPVRGFAPGDRLKVATNTLGGHRNSMEFVLTGLEIEAKEEWLRAQLESRLDPPPAVIAWSGSSIPRPDADTEQAASRVLRCVVKDPDPAVVGKPFTAAGVELALASYPGFTLTAPPGKASPYGVYRPAYVDRDQVHQVVVLDDREIPVPLERAEGADPGGDRLDPPRRPAPAGPTRRLPLGTFVHARSGDKGGDANLGLWVGAGPKREQRIAWLQATITDAEVRRLLPEAAELEIEIHPLPNLGGLNVVLHGLLGEGVAASTRFDPQAKGLGEWARSRYLDIPEELL